MISFIPFMTCLFWFVLNLLLHKKNKEFRTLGFLLLIVGIVSLSQAGTACSNGNSLLLFFLIKQFFAPLLIPVILYYSYRLSPDTSAKPLLQAWIVVPVSLLFAETILMMLSGIDGFIDAIGETPFGGRYDKMVSLIHLCSFWVFYIVLAVQILLWIITVIIKAVKGDWNTQLLNFTLIILVITALELVAIARTESFWLATVLPIILACIIFYASYKDTFYDRIEISIPETEKANETVELPHEPEQIIANVHLSVADEEKLRIRFEDLIVTEQLFLKQGIRISDIATMLETNRTYVSRLVNNTYNMSFSDYINTLRIDYAEQYLMHHKDAKQSDIAVACGFPNASAFNIVFKKITGVTPKIWLATRS